MILVSNTKKTIKRKCSRKILTLLKSLLPPLPLTVREAVELWFPTVKVTVPESAVVTPLSVRLCSRPSALIKFISFFCRGTSWSFHWTGGVSSWESRHWKQTSSPSWTTQLSKNFRMLTSTSVWQKKKNMDSRKCWKLCSFFSTKNAMRFRGSVEESCVNCCEEGKETNDETGDQIQWQGVGTSRGASETVKC